MHAVVCSENDNSIPLLLAISAAAAAAAVTAAASWRCTAFLCFLEAA
jgi:hypothetical protein